MWKKLISGLLAAFMLLSGVPVSALSIESDWIVEFSSGEAAADFLSSGDGRLLGGSLVLTRGTRSDFDFRSDVVSLTPDSSVKGAAVSVNDPKKSSQSYLSDRALYATDGWNYLNAALSAKGLTEADAAPVKVAVIDTGVDGTHEDLKSRVLDGYDVINGTAIPAQTDSDISEESHGTKVAGLIAAETNNEIGIAGLSYTLPVSIVPVRALDASASGKLSDVIAAIYWAVDEGGADIVNMSFGMRRNTRPAALETAVSHAVDKDVILIAAAGNEGRSVYYDSYHYYPAALDGVLAVGSVTKATYSWYYGTVPNYSDFTNRMSSSDPVGKRFFYTMGEDLLTTAKGNAYETFTGTSASAAVFSGVMASLLSVSRATDGIDPRAAFTTSLARYGSVRYHRFDLAAQNLKNGRAVDAWWTGDDYQPSILRGGVAFSGTLSDPSCQMSAVRAVLVNENDEVTELYTEQRDTDAPQQRVSFEWDTTQVPDGSYYYHIIGTYAEPSSSDSEVTLYNALFTIDNAGKNYLLSAIEDDDPMVGAEVALYDSDGALAQDGKTDSRGNFAVSASAADKGGMVAMVKGENNLYLWELETHPRYNAYTLESEPSILTVTASAETLAKLSGAPLTLRLPSGEMTEMATVATGSTSAALCTNMPLTFAVQNDTISLTKEINLADGDKVWSLDEALEEATTVTFRNAYADATGLVVKVGENVYHLPAAGGEVILAPETYNVTVQVYYKENEEDYEADTFTVDFGEVDLTADRTLSVGDAVEGTLTLDKSSLVQNQELNVTFTLRDSLGHPVTDVGYLNNVGEEYEYGYSRINSYSLRLNRAKEDGTWEDLDSRFFEWERQGEGNFGTTLTTSALDNTVGDYRVRLSCNSDWPLTFGDGDWKTFSVTAEENRPSARVNFIFKNFNGYQQSGGGFYVLLQDESGAWISRKAMTPADYWNEPCYTFLPVGASYHGAMMATCYSEKLSGEAAVTTTFTIDLTDKAVGDTVDVTIQPTDEWQVTEFTDRVVSADDSGVIPADGQPIAIPVDNTDLPAASGKDEQPIAIAVNSYVAKVMVYPFAELPDAGVTSRSDDYRVDGILSQHLGETALDITQRVYENYYMTDAVTTLTHDFSEDGTIAVSLPLAPTLTCDEEYYSGTDVTLDYQLYDACRNEIKSLLYQVERKYEEEPIYDKPATVPATDEEGIVTEQERDYAAPKKAYDGVSAPASTEIKAYVTVYKVNGALQGKYAFADVCAGSVKLTGLADGRYTAAATVECPLLTTTGKTVTFVVGGEAPIAPEKVVPVPTNFYAKARSVSSIELSWDPSNETMAKYVIYRDGQPFAEVDGNVNSFTDEGITADRYYTYTLYAVDGEGDRSEGATAGSRPAAAPDTTAPTVPTDLKATLSGSEVVLSWGRSTDNVAVTNYIVTCNGEEIARTYNRNYVHSGRMPGEICSYTVSAIDGAGNRSAESEAAGVTVPNVSGITSASLSYNKNKLGHITDTRLNVKASATADLKTLKATVAFTLLDGTADTRTASFAAGKKGTFSGSVSLPDEFMSVEQVTLEAYRSGAAEASDSRELLAEPVSRANAVTVALTNTENKTLPDFAKKVNVTFKGNGGVYTVTRSVENYAGSFLCFPPSAKDYTFTVTAEDGRELYVRKGITVSDAGGTFTADAADLAMSLRVKLTGLPDGVDMTGIAVSLAGKNQTYTGVTDSQGYITWSEGGQWLSVDKNKCYQDYTGRNYLYLYNYAQTLVTDDALYELYGIYQYCYLSDLINEASVKLSTNVYEMRTITAQIKDRQGRPVKGLTVDIAGKTHEKAVTDEDGMASARVGLYRYNYNGTSYLYNACVSVPKQTAADGRIWRYNSAATKDSCDITLIAESDQFRFVPDIKVYQDGENKPVPDSNAAGADWYVSVTTQKGNYYAYRPSSTYDLTAYNGEWSNSALTIADGDKVTVNIRAELGSLSWRETYETEFDSANPILTPEIVMHEDGVHRLTLNALDEGMLPGVDRRFLVYDQNGELLSDTVSHAAFAYVKLPYRQPVTIVATFDTETENTMGQWSSYGKWAAFRSYTSDGSNEPVTLEAAYSAYFDDLFWQENGYSGGAPTQYRMANGDWRVRFRYTPWDADGTRSKFDYIILPEGAYDVNLGNYTYCSTYNEEEHTITINQKKIAGRYAICYYEFSIPAKKLTANPKLVAWFETKFINGQEYTSYPRELSLRPSGVKLYGGSSAYYEDLTSKGGYQLTVESQLYGNDKSIAIYDDDTLLVYQVMASHQLTFDLPLAKEIRTHTLRVVVTDGTVEDEVTKEVDVTYDDKPMIMSVQATCNNGGGTLVGKGSEHFKSEYSHKLLDSVSVTVQVRRPELIERMWATVKLSKGKTTVNLSKKTKEGMYQGSAICGAKDNPVTGVEVQYILKDDTSDTVKTSIDFDATLGEEGGTYYDISYWEGPTDEQREAHLVSADNDPEQAQALSDWEKYVALIQNGEHMDSDEFFEKLDEVYGDDGEWTLPKAKGDNGEEFAFTFIKESDRAKAFLASDKAFTVLVGGEKVKMGYEIEFCENGEDVFIHFYGDIDLLYPRVPAPDTVSADKWFWENGYGDEKKKIKHTTVKSKRKKPEIPGGGEVVAKGLKVGKLIKDYKDDPDFSDYDKIINDPCSTPSQRDAARQKKLLAMGQHAGDMAIDTISQIGPDETNAGTWGHMALGGGMGYLGNRWDQLNQILDQDPSRTTSPCDNDNSDKEPKKDNKKSAATGSFNPLVDPSGTIFEAVADEPVQGVTATVYYRSADGGEWVEWDSEAYDQPSNPMLSNEDGYYGWNVLMGKWKVVFEKDGYFLAESTELDVPPEHTDVNISLVSSVAPTVKAFTAKADGGSVTLTFDKYMLTKDILGDGAVKVTFGGVTPAGKLTAVNPKTTSKGNKQAVSANDVAGGDEVAKQFTYTFDDPLPTGATVNVTVSDEAAAYNGMTLTEPYEGSVVVPDSDPTVYATEMAFADASLLEKTVGDTFKIGELTFNGTKPGTVKYESSDETVATVDENGNVTAVADGDATIWVTCDTLEAGRPVQVTRKPVVPDETDNAVVFCRKDNLIWNKGCWMWSDGAAYGDGDPIEGDGKYLAVSWRILENGTEKAGANVETGAIAVKEYYTPTATGTLTGEITYQLYTYHENKWVAVEGKTCTAKKDMNVVTVTGLSVKTPPASVGIGDTLNLNELVLNVHTSDGLVSEVPYANFYRWSLTPSTRHGATLTKADRVLTITHPDSGSTVDIELWPSTEHAITVTNDAGGSANASVEKADPGDTVTLTATPNDHYRLKEWQVVSGEITIANDQFTMPDTDVTVKAIFEPDHTLTHFAAVSATCEENGGIEYWHCDGCDKYFADADAQNEITRNDIPVAAPGHDWDEGAVTKAATCEESGTKVYTCRHDASHTKTETVPALGHSLTLVPAVAATCEEDGHSAYYVCGRCNKLFADGTAAIEITDPASVVITALSHDWSDWETITPASENTTGLERRTCSRDASHVETRVLPKLPHTHVLTRAEEVPATCEENGHTAYWTCNGCGKLFADAEGTTEINAENTVIEKLGHAWDEGTVTTAPTCEADGVKTFTCQREASHTKTEPVAKLGHDLKLIPAVAATCEQEGHSAYYECNRCDKLFRDAAGSTEITLDDTVVPAKGHAYGNPVWTWHEDHTATVTLTCGNDASHTKAIPAAMSSKTTDPTCEAAGKTVYTALVTFDGTKYTDEQTVTIPALTHKLSLVEAVAPTCETAGSKAYYVCERCGKWYADATAAVEITDHGSVILAALGHDYGNPHWTWSADGKATVSFTCRHDASHVEHITATVTSKTTAPTCTADGKTVYTAQATFDGRTYTNTNTVTLPALGHELHLIPAVKATCEADGNIAYYLCARCNKLFADAAATREIKLADTVVPAKAHDWNGGVVTTEPSCTEAGVKTFTCLNDPTHTKTESVPALGHTLVRVEEIPAACENDGRAAYYDCTVCDRHFADATGLVEVTDLKALTIPATGHAYVEPVWHWGEANAATAVFTCTHDASHKETVTATVTTDKSAASCEKAGKLTYTAAVIFEGKTYTDSKTVSVPALGHKLRHVKALASTCEADGHTEHWLCKQCGKIFADAEGTTEIAEESIVIAKLGHDWDDGVVTTAPTCEGEGVKTFICQHDATHTRTESIPTLGHKLRYVAAVQPTCENGGSIAYYECDTCGKRFADGTASVAITGEVTLPALGHHFGAWIVTKPATESEEGTETRICQNDPTHTETRVIPKLSHVHKLTAVAEVLATCEKDGHIAYWQCDGCGRIFSDAEGTTEINTEDTVLEKLGHDWDNGVVTNEPTCTEAGVKTFTCKHDASHTFTESLPAFGHRLRYVAEVPATCESEGHTVYYECETCGALFTDAAGKTETAYSDVTLPALGHVYGEPVWTWDGETATAAFTCERDASHVLSVEANVTEATVPATCEADGKRVLTATAECGGKAFTDSRTEVIPAFGHEWNEGELTVAPTCEGEGLRTFTCQNDASHTYTKAVPALGHDWNDGEITVAPTCEGEGVKTFTCKHDATHTYTESIPAFGHKLMLVPAVNATCETEGHIAYYECETCGKRFADDTASVVLSEEETVLPALGHDWSEWTVTKAATEEAEGSETRVCRNDPTHTETRAIPKLSHVHKLTAMEAVPATCETEGRAAHWICDGCGRLFADADGAKECNTEDLVLPALGHEWDDGIVTNEPTCEGEGVKTFTCRHDASHTRTESIPALGHEWDKGVVEQPEDGGDYVIRFTCQRDTNHTRISPLTIMQPSKDYYYYTVLTSYPQNSKEDARFVVKHHGDDAETYSKFLGIAVDNRNVSPDNYVATQGSVVIDLKASYLHTLAVGEHTLRVIFTDGYVDTSFTVTAEQKPSVTTDSPKTGEGSYAALWLMMAASLAAMLAAVRKKRQYA